VTITYDMSQKISIYEFSNNIILAINTPEAYGFVSENINSTLKQMDNNNRDTIITMLAIKAIIIKTKFPDWDFGKEKMIISGRERMTINEMQRNSQKNTRNNKHIYCVSRGIKNANTTYESASCKVCPVCSQFLLTDIDSHYIYKCSKHRKFIHDDCFKKFVKISGAENFVKENSKHIIFK